MVETAVSSSYGHHMTSTHRGVRALTLLVVASAAAVAFPFAPHSAAVAASSDNASCVEKFNVAVGTPGEYQRVFHQDMLGRDVSFFARLSDTDCPF